MKYTILFIILLLCTTLQAKENILVKKGSYTLTQTNVNELILLAEYVGREDLSQDDKQALQAWAIEDFKEHTVGSDGFYKYLSKDVIPYFKLKRTRKSFPAELYQDILKMFKNSKEDFNLLTVIERYNPPKKELLAFQQEQLLQLRILQMNQQNFNMIMNSSQANSNMINNAIQHDSTINAIRLQGDTVLYETDTHIIAKDSAGHEYEVAK